MAVRIDNSVIINLPSVEQFTEKSAIRDFLLRQWILESPQTKYRYFVEDFDNNSKIYLERPGRLNKGCDFIIYAENAYQWKNNNDRPPDHKFILHDLSKKKNLMASQEWVSFLHAVTEIYNSNPFENAVQFTNHLPVSGQSYELSLKLIRWFFIEQDITYWSGLGREMFYNAINRL